MRALEAAGTGEHDTNALEAGFLAIRLVGPDADAIVGTVRPLLGDAPARQLPRGPARADRERGGPASTSTRPRERMARRRLPIAEGEQRRRPAAARVAALPRRATVAP